MVIVLHGRGGTNSNAFGRDGLGLEYFLAAMQGGVSRFALASVDGGTTYWHRRSSGDDAGRMVTDEFLPLLARMGFRTDTVGFLGWSMGGYGGLLLAAELGRERVFAVVAESPALWARAADTAPGAFDDAADFDAHNLFTRKAQLAGIPIRIDCGTGDGFYPAAREFAADLPQRPVSQFGPGGHDVGYWRRMAPQQLAFLAGRLPH